MYNFLQNCTYRHHTPRFSENNCLSAQRIMQDRRPLVDYGTPVQFDFDRASRLWRANKYRDAVGYRYYRSEGDEVYVNTGMRWRAGTVTAVKSSTVDVDVGGRLMRGVSDARTHIQCAASTQFVERLDGDGYDLRPNRRKEKRQMLKSNERVRDLWPHDGRRNI